MKRAVQAILGVVAPDRKRITPSQRELVRRAGTYLSPSQQMTARRRARREEAGHEESKDDFRPHVLPLPAPDIVRINQPDHVTRVTRGLRSIGDILK